MTEHVRVARNAVDALVANGFGLFVSLLCVALLPAVVSVEVFGYWQLYLLYSSFVYVISLGLNDGVYLRHGGSKFDDLDQAVMAGQFRFFAIVSIGCGGLGYVVAYLFNSASPVWWGVALLVPTLNLRSMLMYVMQATNRFRPYALCLIIDRAFFAIALVAILLTGPNLALLVAADLAGKVLSLLTALAICWPMLRERGAPPGTVRREIRSNVAAGSQLMIASLAGTGVLAVVRVAIEQGWGIETFAQISLLLSAAHLMMSFVTAFAQVIFPWLRTLPSSRMADVFVGVRDTVGLIGLVGMLAYLPVYESIRIFLPGYAKALPYLALQFPLIVFESKISLLVNAYSNTLRRENTLMRLNLAALSLSVVLAVIFGYFAQSLSWMVASMLLVQAFRAIVGELYLAREMARTIWPQLVGEAIAVLVFVLSASFLGPYLGTVAYLVAFGFNIIIRRSAYVRVLRRLLSTFSGPRG